MVTKNYLSVNEKIKVETNDGQIYHLGKPNDFDERALYAGSGALIFCLCRVLGLKEGEPLKVVADGKPWPFWGSPSEIISINIIDS